MPFTHCVQIFNTNKMLSVKLVKEVLREVKYAPRHAYKITQNRIKKGVYPYQKYPFGKHRKQYLCWFEPAQVTKKHIILFYHGGGWTFGKPEIFSDRARLFAKEGYQVIMPSHRKLPFNSYLEIREDLILTLKKIYKIMQTKDLLHKKIILGGMSSGGNLAALLCLDHSLLKNTGFTPAHFPSAFLCGAPVNLIGMTNSFLLTNYAGKRASATFKKASPINFLSTTVDKSMLLIHGTADGLVNYQSTADFVARLTEVSQAAVDFYTLPRGSHLQAVSWAYENNVVRQRILNWLRLQETTVKT